MIPTWSDTEQLLQSLTTMPLSRLIKTRSKVTVMEPTETVEEERPPRFSIANLQNRRVVTTQRQLPHRQFSDTYAENLKNNALLDGNERYPNRAVSLSVLSQQIDKPTSPLATPEPSIDLVRPFRVPTGKIDIEQAIHLLQELKKTASPEELVSLHRALLPVKEVSPVYSPQVLYAEDPMFSTAFPPDRRRSVMPPGLATRNKGFEDILRKHESYATVHTASKERREIWAHPAENNAGGQQNLNHEQSITRPETPFEQPNTGAYHCGTLRITNGAASPDPSIILKIATQNRVANLEPTNDIEFGQLNWLSERPRPGGPRLPQRQYRGTENAEVEANGIQRPRSVLASRPSPQTSRASFEHPNSVPTSPLKARYQQRWSHRAAHLSQQYLSDCDIGGSPFDEETAQIELMKRLSSVPDLDGDDAGQYLHQHVDAMSKLTGGENYTDKADSELLAVQAACDALEDVRPDPLARPLKKVDSGYQSDASSSPRRQLALHGAVKSNALSVPEPHTPAHEKKNQTSDTERTLLLESASTHALEEGTTSPRTDAHLIDTSLQAKRPSPLALLKRNKASERGSVSSLSDVMAASSHSKGLPLPCSEADSVKQPKKLQKRIPESVRYQRQLEAEKQAANEDSKGANVPISPLDLRANGFSASPQSHVTSNQDGRTATPVTTGDSHGFRLRGKSFGRTRSKTNATEPINELEAQTSPLKTRARRSISVSSHIDVFSDSNHGMNGMIKSGQEQQSLERVRTDFQTVARALSSHPPYTCSDGNDSIAVPKFVHGHSHGRLQPCQDSVPESDRSQSATQDSLQDVPTAKSPPRATLEGYQRVIPIGANGSVEELFPEWQSRPAALFSPVSIPPTAYLQARQLHKPRSPLSISSIPPLPELPADIESKLSRADHVVAKKMLNSPRNSARNSPLSSVRNSEDSASGVRRRPANRFFAVQDDDDTAKEPTSGLTRWSVDGAIPLPRAGSNSKPASPTHDSQHPGWPGWEKQAELWRQRKADLGRALTKTVDMVGKIPVESEVSPRTPPIVVSRHDTPLEEINARNVRPSPERNSSTEQLAQAYTYVFTEDKENWPARQRVQRTDSVDSSATMSSEDRSVMPDVSRNGSAYSSASSSSPTATSPGSATKPPMHASSQSFTPYRAADAVQAERSRALSRARRTCNIPPDGLHVVQSHNASMPQMKAASVLDRYSGGLGYGWDRSTGFGGSAGTLSSGTESANRKSVKISEDYGLDLSDVPVFLRKAHTGHF